MENKKTRLIPYLKTLCINIEDLSARDKLNVLISTIKNEVSGPDVVCLTEVSESAFKYLSASLDDYVFFQVFISEEEETGSVILCNKKTVAISETEPPYYFDYNQGKGRIMGTGIVHQTTGLTFNILTADIDHATDDVRERQFATLAKVIKSMDNYVIMGDLGKAGEGVLKDAWITVGCPTRLSSTTVNIQERLTRILYAPNLTNNSNSNSSNSSNSSNLTNARKGCLNLKSLSLVGTKHQIGTHYGLEGVFQIVKK